MAVFNLLLSKKQRKVSMQQIPKAFLKQASGLMSSTEMKLQPPPPPFNLHQMLKPPAELAVDMPVADVIGDNMNSQGCSSFGKFSEMLKNRSLSAVNGQERNQDPHRAHRNLRESSNAIDPAVSNLMPSQKSKDSVRTYQVPEQKHGYSITEQELSSNKS